METFCASFTTKPAYDDMPSPKNLSMWYGENPCTKCYTKTYTGGLQDQPHSRPIHLAAEPTAMVSYNSDRKSVAECKCPSSPFTPLASNSVVWEGKIQVRLTISRQDIGCLGRACNRKMLADLSQRLCFLAEIMATNLRPWLA